MRKLLLWLPLAGFALLFVVVASGLYRPVDRTVRSAMIGKPLPDFALPAMVAGQPGVSAAGFRAGTPRLLNVFASWCVPCIAEAPQLLRLKAMGVPIDGIAIRDNRADVAAFLVRGGNPYAGVGDDPRSAVQLAIGSSGVPETFLVDGKGVILRQHVGDIRADDVDALYAAWKAAR